MKEKMVGVQEQLSICYAPPPMEGEPLPHILSGGSFQTIHPYCYSRSRLDSYLLLYTVSGRGTLSYRGHDGLLRQGDLFFIDCREPQVYRSDGENWRFSFFHVDRSPQMTACYRAATHDGEQVVFRSPLFLQELFDPVMKELPLDSYRSRLSCSERLSRLLSRLLISLMADESDIPPAFARTQEYLRLHFAQPLPIEELAQQAHLSPCHFVRQFKVYYGLSPHEYLKAYRNTRACELLVLTDQSVEEIAESVGYGSPSGFCKAFRQLNHLTPGQYRKASFVRTTPDPRTSD